MRFICNFWGVSSCVFVAIHRVLKNKCDLFFVFLSVCTTLAEVEYHSRTREACFAHREPLKMRRVPEKGVSGTEYPFRTTGGCCVPGAPENASRTTGGLFAHTNICSVPEKGVSGTEYHSRTRKACFLRRVPQEPVLRTARIFRTTGGLLRYRMSRMPQMAEERSLFPRRNHRQIPHKCQEKGLFPRQHYRKSNKHQKKEASSQDSTIGKFPTTAIPWQQGNIYSGGGAPTHGFNYFLTLFL